MFGVLLCIMSLIAGLGVNYYDAKAEREVGVTATSENTANVNFSDMKEFNYSFYLLMINGLLLYGSFYGLTANLNDLITTRFGFDSSGAGDLIMVVYLLAVVLLPIFGIYSDYFGRRMIFIMIGSTIFFGVHMVLAFIPNGSLVNPNFEVIVPLAGFGLFYAIYGAIYWPCISLVVPEKLVGTAFGIATALQNLMLTVVPLMLGAIHDYTVDTEFGYFWTEIALAGLVGLGNDNQHYALYQ